MKKAQQVTPIRNLEKFVLPALLGALLLVDPVFIDIQIARPKLLLLELGTFVLVLVYLMNAVIRERIKWNGNGMNVPVLVYAAYIGIHFLFSPNKAVASSEFKRMLLCSAIFFVAANSSEPEQSGSAQRWLILAGFITGSAAAAVYGLMQHWGHFLIFVVPQMDRVFSTFGNPIFFAAHLVIFLPVLLGVFFALEKKHFLPRSLILIVFAVGLAALYFTKTRAAWIGFILAMLLFGILRLRLAKKRMVFLVILGLGIAVFLAVTWNVWLRHQAHPLIWRDTLRMCKDYPVFGTGIGTFHINFPRYASEELLKIWPQKERIINDAHNEYIQILSETGIVGICIYAWMIYAFFNFGFKRLTLRNDSLAAGFVSAGAAILAQNFFSVDMRFIISAFYFFLVGGLIFSLGGQRVEANLRLAAPARALLTLVIVFLSGLAGFGRNRSNNVELHLLQLAHFDTGAQALRFGPSDEGSGMLPQILKPYLAQKRLSQETGFFDEKVLEPYKTIADLELLAKKHPNESMIYEKLGWVYSKEKNFSKAIENYEKAIKLNPNSYGSYNNLGNISFLLGQRAKAIEYYKKSLSINPNQLDAHTNMGIAFYYEGRLREAASEFDAVLKLDPNNEKAIVMLKKMRE
jgi:tetratricopeptide (TPR) repeat protein